MVFLMTKESKPGVSREQRLSDEVCCVWKNSFSPGLISMPWFWSNGLNVTANPRELWLKNMASSRMSLMADSIMKKTHYFFLFIAGLFFLIYWQTYCVWIWSWSTCILAIHYIIWLLNFPGAKTCFIHITLSVVKWFSSAWYWFHRRFYPVS